MDRTTHSVTRYQTSSWRPSATYRNDDDYPNDDPGDIYFLHWVITPVFFLLFMALAIACWYRRYKMRQQMMEHRRNHQQAIIASVGYSGTTGVNLPPSAHYTADLPSFAYPRQAYPPAYVVPGPPAMHCPSYDTALNNNINNGPYAPAEPQEPGTVRDATLPPAYDDVIKQPKPNVG